MLSMDPSPSSFCYFLPFVLSSRFSLLSFATQRRPPSPPIPLLDHPPTAPLPLLRSPSSSPHRARRRRIQFPRARWRWIGLRRWVAFVIVGSSCHNGPVRCRADWGGLVL
ncbi:Os01g0863166 [Oryza sativa Japonica Group]|uniref:Os01g0863166 protein n=1 Tax=Oryza sativa subsp. japonica TaxID=39947 RepID=C7IX89_ORYSJ|nr:Os01g0863166 [Oryza sativa Japonica Group]|eukprot:NP_001172665.1 Os01g0863166 [Oryza sativa Japonica Group]